MKKLWVKRERWQIEYITPVISKEDQEYVAKLNKEGHETKWENLAKQDILNGD